MKNSLLYPILFLSIFFIGCNADEDLYVEVPNTSQLKEKLTNLYGSTDYLILPSSDNLQKIPSDPKNDITYMKVLLGKLLFHETGLSLGPQKDKGTGTYSCATCHHASAGFQSGLKQGIGEGGSGFGWSGESRVKSADYSATEIDIQPIRTPTVINSAYQDVMLWNGQFGGVKTNIGTESNWTEGTPKATNNLGYEGVETQAIAGIGVHRLKCDVGILTELGYKDYFDAAFPEVSETERYSELYAGLAIAAYERSILSNQAPFQKWLNGDKTALSDKEIKGAMVFFGKGKCYSCHTGPSLNSTSFYALGMNDLSGDDVYGEVDETTKLGRGGFTQNPDDNYKFKTPTLYNLKDVHFFGHGGSFSSVKEIIQYKNHGISENKSVPAANISELFTPLGLTDIEIDQLATFVEDALHDPNLNRYVPESLPSDNCFPVADSQSRIEMGCN